MPFLRDYHNKFVSETIDRCQQTLLLFWDQELGPQFLTARAHGKKRVVVLFQGGHNDREVRPVTLLQSLTHKPLGRLMI